MILLSLLKTLHFLARLFGSAASLGNIYLTLAKGPHDPLQNLASPTCFASFTGLPRLARSGFSG